MDKSYQNKEFQQLEKLAHELDADFIFDDQSSRLSFNNMHGVGSIASYQMFPGLVSKTYNVKFKKDFHFERLEISKSPIYFLYCVTGYFFYKNSNETVNYDRIYANQNVIFSNTISSEHHIILPAETDLKLSVIILDREKLSLSKSKKVRKIEDALNILAQSIQLDLTDKYYGSIDRSTEGFSRTLIDNLRVDTIGRLMTEGAILNTLSSQLMHLEKDSNSKSLNLIDSDLTEKIIKIGYYINQNIHAKLAINDLVEKFSINPKKLQAGFQFIFGETVLHFIQRVKMEKAREYLISSNLTISEVCYKIGYSSRSYFSKVFYDTFHMLPREVSNKIKQDDYTYELCYKSIVNSEISKKDIDHILNLSLKTNLSKNITGALIYYSGTFHQIIEGSKQDILELFDKIKKDKRHRNVKKLWSGAKLTKSFSSWSMAFLTDKNQNVSEANDNITYINLDQLINKSEENKEFTDLMWRRALVILENNQHSGVK